MMEMLPNLLHQRDEESDENLEFRRPNRVYNFSEKDLSFLDRLAAQQRRKVERLNRYELPHFFFFHMSL
jgi:hypothetical protein